jgi:beta-glucosidase
MILRIMTPYYHLKQDVGYPPIDGYTPRLGLFPESSYLGEFNLGPVVDVREAQHAKYVSAPDLGGWLLYISAC